MASKPRCKVNQARLALLERRLLGSQLVSRGLGFLLFVFLGGVVAYLLTGRVKVTGFDGTLPQVFQAIAIGAGWTGFLSVFGIRNIQESASKQVDAVKDSTVQQLIDLKSSLGGLVRPGPAQGPSMVPFSARPTSRRRFPIGSITPWPCRHAIQPGQGSDP